MSDGPLTVEMLIKAKETFAQMPPNNLGVNPDDYPYFKRQIDQVFAGKSQTVGPFPVADFFGMRVYKSKRVPRGEVWLVRDPMVLIDEETNSGGSDTSGQ